MPFNRAMNIIIIAFGCLVAPYWYLFNFSPTLIKGLDVVQLILTCEAIALPIFLLNFILIAIVNQRSNRKFHRNYVDRDLSIMLSSSINLCILFYLPSIFVYFGEQNNGVESLVKFQIGIFLAILFKGCIDSYKAYRKYKRLKKKRMAK